MKPALYLFFLITLFLNHAEAQTLKETEIPVKVREAYKKKYPTVKDGKWKKEGESFQVSHLANKKQGLVLYDETGKVIQSETEVKFAELPKPMTDFIVANFRGKKPTGAFRITDNSGKLSYAAEIDYSRYVFDDKGNFVKQEQGRE